MDTLWGDSNHTLHEDCDRNTDGVQLDTSISPPLSLGSLSNTNYSDNTGLKSYLMTADLNKILTSDFAAVTVTTALMCIHREVLCCILLILATSISNCS